MESSPNKFRNRQLFEGKASIFILANELKGHQRTCHLSGTGKSRATLKLTLGRAFDHLHSFSVIVSRPLNSSFAALRAANGRGLTSSNWWSASHSAANHQLDRRNRRHNQTLIAFIMPANPPVNPRPLGDPLIPPPSILKTLT